LPFPVHQLPSDIIQRQVQILPFQTPFIRYLKPVPGGSMRTLGASLIAIAAIVASFSFARHRPGPGDLFRYSSGSFALRHGIGPDPEKIRTAGF
jgi:hypothetical protein